MRRKSIERRFVIILLIAVALLIAPFSRPDVYAAGSTNVTDHTQEEIRAYIERSGAAFSDSTEYSTKPVNPSVRGAMSENSKQAALRILNNIRYIAGLNEVGLSDYQGSLAQAAAFVDWSIGKLTHYPAEDGSQPEGMSDEDWSDGIRGCGSSNLARGYGSINSAVYGWTTDSDSSNIDRVGHRRWMLNPKMGTTGFGAAGSFYAMYSFDNSGSGTQTNVAWPAKNMPLEYFSVNLPWTFSTGNRINANSVRVRLTRLNDNKVWEFSGAESYSPSETKYFNVNNDGYGQSGCIIFRPDGVEAFRDGDRYRVDITGAGSDISYTVNFFSLVPMTGIKFDSEEVSVHAGATTTLNLVAVPSNTSDSIDRSRVTYSIEDTDIATVDGDGVITAGKLGKTKITASYRNAANKTFTATADLYVAKSILDDSVNVVSVTNPVYTGSPVLPSYVIQDGEYTLVQDVDYYLQPYSELVNVNDGYGFVLYYGKGKYYDGQWGFYSVDPKPVTSDMVTLKDTSYVYDGKPHSPEVALEYNGMTLVEGTDFTMSKTSGTDAGTYELTIWGEGNYSGTYKAQFTINPKSITNGMFSIDYSGLVYNGKEQKPAVTAKDGSTVLQEGVDFTIACDDAVNAGRHTMTIIGKGNYTGNIRLAFYIEKADHPQNMPDEKYTVSMSKTSLGNEVLNNAENWIFNAADLGTELARGDNFFEVKYIGADADNYISTTTKVNVLRDCTHPKASQERRYVIAASCEKAGYSGDIYCSVCGDFLSAGREIAMLGHNWSSWFVEKAATTSEEGIEARKCSRCGEKETRAIPKADAPVDTPSDKPSDTPSDTPSDKPSDASEEPAVDPVNQTGADGTALGEGASVQAAEAAIAGMTSDNDLPGAVFGKLQLRSKKQTNTSISLSWKKVAGASSYVIYGNKCGKTNKMKILAVSGGKSKKFTKVLGKKLKKGTYYKFMVVALDKNNNVVSSSKIIHVATKGGKVGNVKKITSKAKKNKVTVKAKKTFKLKAKQVAASKNLKVKRHVALRYETSNAAVATVSSKGVIKGIGKGQCKVYVYAQNGVFTTINVTVK